MSYPSGIVAIDAVRLLIGDRDGANEIFTDAEITLAYSIQGNVWQSAQFFSYPGGALIPSAPVSYLRVAALLLDSLASSASRLAAITQLLDVKLDSKSAAKALQDQAKIWREVDDDLGAIFIIEQVNNDWSFRDRFWKQIQRQSAQ